MALAGRLPIEEVATRLEQQMTSQSTGQAKPGPGRPVFGESLGILVGDWDVSRINRSIYIYICIIMHINILFG